MNILLCINFRILRRGNEIFRHCLQTFLSDSCSKSYSSKGGILLGFRSKMSIKSDPTKGVDLRNQFFT